MVSTNSLKFRKKLLQKWCYTAKPNTISPLSSGNTGKCNFLTREEVLLDRGLLEKAATIRRFENSPLGSELKKDIDIAKKKKKQHQGLDKLMNLMEQ